MFDFVWAFLIRIYTLAGMLVSGCRSKSSIATISGIDPEEDYC